MAADRLTCDTSILFYAIDAHEPLKQKQAALCLQLLRDANAVLLLQTLSELCAVVTRRRKELLPSAQLYMDGAREIFEVVAAVPDDLSRALAAHRSHLIPFWDALLWATAHRIGCTLILTEDFQDGRALQGVTFRNPFTMSPQELRVLLR